MMMGPEPMSRIDLMSVRLGILFAQLFQEPYEFLCPNNGLAHFLLCQRWRRGKRISIYNVIAGDLLTETPVFVKRRSEEHTSELQSRGHLVCRLLLEKKKQTDARHLVLNTSSLQSRHRRWSECRCSICH